MQFRSQEPKLTFVGRRARRERRHAAFERPRNLALEAVAAHLPAAICSLTQLGNKFFVQACPEAETVFLLTFRASAR